MAKQRRALPARKQGDRSRDDESLLMRSAESLGRMIGTLQRQLDGASKRLSDTADDVIESFPAVPQAGGGPGGRKRAAAKSVRPRTGRSTAARKTAARKPTRARKDTPARKRGASAATKRTAKKR